MIISKVEFGTRRLPISNRDPQAWEKQRPKILQVHGVRTIEVTKPAQEDRDGADAFFTRIPGFPVSVNTADCIPILVSYEADERWVMAVHAGWRGLHQKILAKSIQQVSWITGEQVQVPRLQLWVGPHIQKCCYEVGPEVWNEFHEYGLERSESPQYLDLNFILQKQIAALGILDVKVLGHCTKCHQTDGRFTYLSYRRGDRLSRQRSFIEFS